MDRGTSDRGQLRAALAGIALAALALGGCGLLAPLSKLDTAYQGASTQGPGGACEAKEVFRQSVHGWVQRYQCLQCHDGNTQVGFAVPDVDRAYQEAQLVGLDSGPNAPWVSHATNGHCGPNCTSGGNDGKLGDAVLAWATEEERCKTAPPESPGDAPLDAPLPVPSTSPSPVAANINACRTVANFTNMIRPILAAGGANCIGCHSAGHAGATQLNMAAGLSEAQLCQNVKRFGNITVAGNDPNGGADTRNATPANTLLLRKPGGLQAPHPAVNNFAAGQQTTFTNWLNGER